MDTASAQSDIDQASFRAIADLAYEESGLTLVAEKTPMIQSRLRHRLRALEMDDLSEYAAFIRTDAGQPERRQLISALTTNVSHFFREAHHFETMLTMVKDRLPLLEAGGRLRLWSAGCSNGQEPLSIAMSLMERFPGIARHDLLILATDIDPAVVQFARAGLYPERMIRGVDPALREKYFVKGSAVQGQTTYQARPEIMALIRFNELNLLGQWPMRHPFDVIFCRNVVIYFDAMTQDRLWPRFCSALRKPGLLFLGHSERIADPQMAGFDSVGTTTYRPAGSGFEHHTK